MGPTPGTYASGSAPAQQAAPPAYGAWLSADRLARFQSICQQYEISDNFASRLRGLERFDIVLLCDDSGSMRTPVTVPSAFAPAVTRWDELKQSVVILSSIAACMDDDGIDIYFLNRPPLLSVKDSNTITPAFIEPPTGFTPIAARLQQILAQRSGQRPQGDNKPLLIVIFTDGEPTDERGTVNVAQLEQVLYSRQAHVYTTFVACTDDDQVVAYLNKWDTNLPRVDVCDDYQSEKKEILAAQGQNFRFSHGDYCCKLLLGTIDPQMDRLDERQPAMNHAANNGGGCCVMM